MSNQPLNVSTYSNSFPWLYPNSLFSLGITYTVVNIVADKLFVPSYQYALKTANISEIWTSTLSGPQQYSIGSNVRWRAGTYTRGDIDTAGCSATANNVILVIELTSQWDAGRRASKRL